MRTKYPVCYNTAANSPLAALVKSSAGSASPWANFAISSRASDLPHTYYLPSVWDAANEKRCSARSKCVRIPTHIPSSRCRSAAYSLREEV